MTPAAPEQKGSNFRAQVYEPVDGVFGDDMKPQVVFRGTVPILLGGLEEQHQAGGGGWNAPDYGNAVKIGNAVGSSGESSSLGILWEVASPPPRRSRRAWGEQLSRRLDSPEAPSRNTEDRSNRRRSTPTTWRARFTNVQENSLGGTALAFGVGGVVGAVAKTVLGWLTPNAVGTPYSLPGSGINPVARHGMDQVIPALRRRWRRTRAKLEKATGIKCSC